MAHTQAAQNTLQSALEACITGAGGFSWFGGRSRRLLRVFMDHLAAFARQCLADDLASAVLQFFGNLRGRLNEKLRDMSFVRQRLRGLQEILEVPDQALEEPTEPVSSIELSPGHQSLVSTESFWHSIRESTTARVVLPGGTEDLDQAAARFLVTLTPDHWVQLDQALQDQVLAPCGGLFKACMGSIDVQRHLIPALLSQASTVLGTLLPVTDVAQVELSLGQADPGELANRLESYHEQAVPVLGASPIVQASGSSTRLGSVPELAKPPENQHSFLLIPGSDSGKNYGEEARQSLEALHIVNVPGQADLMFCRELDYLRFEDLERILNVCRGAYEELVTVPNTSPHARFDIQDWAPLNP
jgi:hypothetical protein